VVFSQEKPHLAIFFEVGTGFGKSRMLDQAAVVLLAKGTAQPGDLKIATEVIKSALTWQNFTADMFSTLAGYYRASREGRAR
jgi:hypothetical protein